MTPAPAPPVRTAHLPGGPILTVRRMVPGDADALARLYDGLSDDDRYRRFFSLYKPDRAAVENWAADNDHGKIRLTVVVSADDGTGPPRLVGDGLCVPLPDGDGEFALTVAEGWRGWLGPYLLDTLAEVAAEQGMRNLQADILNENRRMMAVVRARGYAVMDHPDFTQTRVTTGTGPPTPAWPPVRRRPRVLVEARGTRSALHRSLQQSGFEVITCPGPGRRCPLMAGRPCPLVLEADAVVFAVPADDPQAPALVAGHGRIHPGVLLRSGEDLRSGPSALSTPRCADDAETVSRSVVELTPPPLLHGGRLQKGSDR